MTRKPGRRRKPLAPADCSDPRGFPVLTAQYLEHLRVRNYSPRTVMNCRVYLGYFTAWAAERGLTRPSEITKPILDRYQRWLYHYRNEDTGRPLSFRTQHVRLTPIRTFFKWLAKENYLLSNPASELELPKLEKRLPKHVLSVAEVEQVLNSIDLADALGVRDRAMVEVLYSTGMRRSELLHLAVVDLDTERGTLFIRQGKGQKDRMIPIGDRAIRWIEKYQRELRPALVVAPDPGTLFLTTYGEPFTPGRLTQLVGRIVRGAGIGKTGACHLFRHTMATLMLAHGAPPCCSLARPHATPPRRCARTPSPVVSSPGPPTARAPRRGPRPHPGAEDRREVASLGPADIAAVVACARSRRDARAAAKRGERVQPHREFARNSHPGLTTFCAALHQRPPRGNSATASGKRATCTTRVHPIAVCRPRGVWRCRR